MAALGLCCHAWAFPSCSEWGPPLVALHGPLIAGASPIAEHGHQARGPSSCGMKAVECRLHGMWDLPGPGLEPVSPALAGGFSTTAPPGKPVFFLFTKKY